MRKIILAAFIGLVSVGLVYGLAYAAVTGECVNCHTMHNSQGGTGMELATFETGPFEALLRGSCLGCHTGINDGTNTTPYVFSTTEPTYGTDGTTGNTLAGGNFYWADTDATTGHNVPGLGSTESLTAPPGYDGGRADAQGNIPGGGTWSGSVTCAGANGCHGTHVSGQDDMAGVRGAHHTNVGGSLTTADSVANSYRFLIGIHGYEDSDWEYQPTASAHNQYKGVARTGNVSDTSTISWLCGECHGEFHTYATDVGSSSPWLRHPTDLSLNDVTGTEYESYNNATDPTSAPYSVAAPVASTDVSAVLSTVDVSKGAGTDNAIVTCISCHRAHGTPYSDLLRWDYSAIVAGGGGGNIGCFICHTTKD